jgi:hypothetical protein
VQVEEASAKRAQVAPAPPAQVPRG